MIERPAQAPDMAAAQALLAGTDIQLDTHYGPILINPKLGRYVVRGLATPEAWAKAEKIRGVRLFADAQQKPLARPRSRA